MSVEKQVEHRRGDEQSLALVVAAEECIAHGDLRGENEQLACTGLYGSVVDLGLHVALNTEDEDVLVCLYGFCRTNVTDVVDEGYFLE